METVGRLQGLRAEFVQTRTVALTGEEIEARGMLAFRPPASFRLAFAGPDPQEVVVQGDSLWVVLPAERQALRYPFDPGAPGSEVFVLFGPSGRRLDEVFRVETEPWDGHPDALLLTPRSGEAGQPVEEMRLVVDARGLPRRLFLREVTGDTVVFDFVRVEVDPPDLDRDLRLRLPPGTEILSGEDLGAGR
jgi:outer membrane lipoprotein-sorting protein